MAKTEEIIMGKAADNEKLKLRATYYNNIAVAFLITGFVVPYLAVTYKAAEFGSEVSRQGLGFFEGLMTAFSPRNLLSALLPLTVFAISVYLSATFRRWANEELDKIID
jgi:hypothetical protein